MQITNVLKLADIFYDLSSAQLDLVAAICTDRTCHAGETVFEENSLAQDMFVIARGEIEILLDPTLVDDGPPERTFLPQVIATLRAGQIFGEIALVDQGIRSASARAIVHDTQLIVLSRDKLMHLCETEPQLGFRLMRNLAADLAMKIRSADIEIRSRLLWRPHA